MENGSRNSCIVAFASASSEVQIKEQDSALLIQNNDTYTKKQVGGTAVIKV